MTHATLICLRYAHEITYIQNQMDIQYTTLMFCISFNGQMRGIMQNPMEKLKFSLTIAHLRILLNWF